MLSITTMKDLFRFLMERKKFWLAPVIIVLVLLGIFVVIGNSQIIANVYAFW